jgi:hypothetical protein
MIPLYQRLAFHNYDAGPQTIHNHVFPGVTLTGLTYSFTVEEDSLVTAFGKMMFVTTDASLISLVLYDAVTAAQEDASLQYANTTWGTLCVHKTIVAPSGTSFTLRLSSYSIVGAAYDVYSSSFQVDICRA